MLLGHRIFLFKRGALETVFTIALIVAVLASLGAFVNQITARTRELKEFGNPSGGAVVFGENFEESSAFLQEIRASFEPRISENLISASLPLDGEERGITVRAVDIRDFIKTRGGQLEGEIARENHEADVGEFLAEMADVEVGENIEVEVSGEEVELLIVGTVRTHGQSDVGLLVPRGSVLNEPGRVRMTVFEGAWEENADRINPPGGAGGNGQSRTKIIGTARVGRFIEETNTQILSFLTVWSLVISVIVAAVAGVGTSRLVDESREELRTLSEVGASRTKLLGLVLSSVAAIALSGSLIGISLGLAGSQTISKILGWMGEGIGLAPHLGVGPLLKILGLATVSSVLGGFIASVTSLRRLGP